MESKFSQLEFPVKWVQQFAVAIILILILSQLASAAGSTNGKVWTTVGVVEDPYLTPKSIMLRHEKIDGLMPAMTMPFGLESKTLLDGVNYFDTVEVQFRQTNDHFVIQKLSIIKPAQSKRKNVHSSQVDTSTAVIPWNLEFVDAIGNTRRLKDFQQDHIVVNFIFTRCPTVCPLQTAKLQSTLDNLTSGQKEQVAFVSISLDPEFDRPEQLKLFAEQRGIDTTSWSFLTGTVETVNRALNSFNILAVGQENGDIDHSQQIFLLSATDGILKIYDGNIASLAEDLFSDISELVHN